MSELMTHEKAIWLVVICTPFVSLPFKSHLPELAFTPRGLIHSNEILPLLLAPFAPLLTLGHLLSHLCHSIILLRLTPPLRVLYTFTLALYLFRTLIGFLLSRSVGWAYPSFFSHWALYEPTTGWGPAIIAYLIANSTDLPAWTITAILVSTCILDQAPWTNGLAIVLALIWRITKFTPRQDNLPMTVTEKNPKSSSSSPGHVQLRYVIIGSLVFVPYFFVPSTRHALPSTTSLEIIVLSFPRPVDTSIGVELLNTTLDSWIPHVSPLVSLSKFTHAPDHPAWTAVAESRHDVTFYADTDQHPTDVDGHYLHLAELFRWAETRNREWTMLAEDDFPLCAGRWDVVETVMYELETRRLKGEISAGFIGTGGSGLIIHKSFLPVFTLILRSYAAQQSPVPASTTSRAPDQIVQDCLIGREGSLCAHDGRMVITSRLILDHIGGMATTSRDKALNSDKWRCGWRHAFHGDEKVDVVVV